ncbi:hypothetical protein B0T25DRAFT_167852 [Lasiosphaeria hispida]|uniref:NCT transcriptional regulatory complex subunit A n=2 Tax=Lasiosphaeriaceae TaxID=42302 RepID=A0AAJ0MGE5_9PEZI|nr:hypothetical protein B0T25DRAFT_167852 [Lasiosphaeria hispida]
MSGDGTGTYAPKSPDLSSFYSEPGPTYQPLQSAPDTQPQHPQDEQRRPLSQQAQSQISPQHRLHLQPPLTTYFAASPASATIHLNHQPRAQQQQQQLSQLSQLQTPQTPAEQASEPTNILGGSYSPYFSQQPQQRLPKQQHSYSPREPPQFSGHSVTQASAGYTALQASQHPPFYGQPTSYLGAQYQQQPQQPQQQQQFPSTTPITTSLFYGSSHSAPATSGSGQQQQQPGTAEREGLGGPMPPKRASAAQVAAAQAAAAAALIEPSPVKTKFPTARIKRIMQADEEVGKVAQQTPIAVGKALEMFMVALVTKSADVAREKNSKRVSAQMLKQVVESDDQWDFLREIVSRVENEDKGGPSVPGPGAAGAKGRAPKAESESEEEEPVEKKKRVGRKRKAA